jgi:hypothetical protein
MAEKMTNTQVSIQESAQVRAHPSAAAVGQEDDIQRLARLAGLEVALARFPEDVATAARTALNIRAAFQAPIDNTAELWPVMQVKS